MLTTHVPRPLPLQGSAQSRAWPKIQAILRVLARVAMWPARVWIARREFAKLAGMSDHELHDIGLTRQDLRDATALSLDQDPTRFLASRSPRPVKRGRIRGRPML